MTLREVIDQYIAWRQARGARFQSQAYALRRYSRGVGDAIGCDEVGSDQARAFLAAGATAASNRAFLHSALAGFYRYAIARGLATRSPLPAKPPQVSQRAAPYIYTRAELRRAGRHADLSPARQPAGAAYLPRSAAAAVRSWLPARGGTPPHAGRCRPARRAAHRAQD